MREQNDLQTVAKFTKAIVAATSDPGLARPDSKLDVTVMELATQGQATVAHRYVDVANACIRTKADMARACSQMAQESDALEKAAKSAINKVNDSAAKMAQSLQKTKDMMGPQVEDRLRQMERFVDCIERMHALDVDGVVSRFAAALKR